MLEILQASLDLELKIQSTQTQNQQQNQTKAVLQAALMVRWARVQGVAATNEGDTEER